VRAMFSFVALGAIFSQTFAQQGTPSPLVVVPAIDLQKYSGTWYEIARLPNRFQANCAGDVTATYMIDGDGYIVVNRCRNEKGEIVEATGRARRASPDGPSSQLEVRFAPAVLSFLPFVWGKYWVIDLSPDYQYAVVGEPKREYLWVLSRSSTLPDTTLRNILSRVEHQGYDLRDLIYTKHSGAQ